MVDILKQDHTVKALKGKEIRELAIGFVGTNPFQDGAAVDDVALHPIRARVW